MSVLPFVLLAHNNHQYDSFFSSQFIKFLPEELSFHNRKPIQAFIKRLFDVLVCSLGFIIISPALLILAILIKLDSKGPIIFKQKRIGLNAKEFYMYKFRSMHVSSNSNEELLFEQYLDDNQSLFKLKDDPRVTKIGKFIRKYSLDEFPQLINVIKGEMSLVGPRPKLPEELPHFAKRNFSLFAATPGITGLWQTCGRSSVRDFDRVAAMDYHYYKKWNLLLDLYLLLKTIPAVISGDNAY